MAGVQTEDGVPPTGASRLLAVACWAPGEGHSPPRQQWEGHLPSFTLSPQLQRVKHEERMRGFSTSILTRLPSSKVCDLGFCWRSGCLCLELKMKLKL